MAETIQITPAEAEEFRTYKRYRIILGKAFRFIIKVGLSKKEISHLIKYLQYRDKINKVFEIKGGSGTIHLDKDGNIRKVDLHTQVY